MGSPRVTHQRRTPRVTESPGAVSPRFSPLPRCLQYDIKMSSLGRRSMGNVTIRNLDDQVIDALKAQAKANQRSLEAELRFVLSQEVNHRLRMAAFRERTAQLSVRQQTCPKPIASICCGRIAIGEAHRRRQRGCQVVRVRKHSEEARLLLGHRLERLAPDFVLVELANIFWKKCALREIGDPDRYFQSCTDSRVSRPFRCRFDRASRSDRRANRPSGLRLPLHRLRRSNRFDADHGGSKLADIVADRAVM